MLNPDQFRPAFPCFAMVTFGTAILANPSAAVHDPGELRGTMAYLLTDEPAIGAVPILPIKDRCLANVDAVGKKSDDASNQRTENPPLGAVQKCKYPTSQIFPAAKLLHPVCIGYAVMDPVGRGKLVVPDSLVGE